MKQVLMAVMLGLSSFGTTAWADHAPVTPSGAMVLAQAYGVKPTVGHGFIVFAGRTAEALAGALNRPLDPERQMVIAYGAGVDSILDRASPGLMEFAEPGGALVLHGNEFSRMAAPAVYRAVKEGQAEILVAPQEGHIEAPL